MTSQEPRRASCERGREYVQDPTVLGVSVVLSFGGLAYFVLRSLGARGGGLGAPACVSPGRILPRRGAGSPVSRMAAFGVACGP
eukprot:7378453-Prymnesium_polylepis.2